jgi:type I restriction enzyme M protein
MPSGHLRGHFRHLPANRFIGLGGIVKGLHADHLPMEPIAVLYAGLHVQSVARKLALRILRIFPLSPNRHNRYFWESLAKLGGVCRSNTNGLLRADLPSHGGIFAMIPDLYSEQDVETKVVVPELVKLGYDEKKRSRGVVLRFQHPITAQQGRQKKTIRADVVVFVNDSPLIVVDSKNPRQYLTDNDREQVISYARLIGDIAPYAALCNGHTWQVFDAVTKQQIQALPTFRELIKDIQQRRLTSRQRKTLTSQATRTLFAIDSARDLSRLMRRCHDTIRNIRGYDPTKAFDELSKLLFAKMYEEREISEGRRKQNRFTSAAVQEMRQQGVEIVQTLWKDTIESDRYREVFSDQDAESGIELPPEAIDTIVAILEDKSLGLTDLDVKGVAFEEFLSATYRGGGLGQYFTPREVVNFMVDLVEPAIGERIVDPACGTGGFLIRSYDVVRDKIVASTLSTREKNRRLDLNQAKPKRAFLAGGESV